MSYSVVDTEDDSIESVHATLDAAERHMHEQSTVVECQDGIDVVRWTTYRLHHRIRNDATGNWIEHES